MSRLSLKKLNTIRERVAATTQLPWVITSDRAIAVTDESRGITVPLFHAEAPIDLYKKKSVTPRVVDRAQYDQEANLAFVKNAHDDMPALLGYIHELEEDGSLIWRTLSAIRVVIHAHFSDRGINHQICQRIIGLCEGSKAGQSRAYWSPTHRHYKGWLCKVHFEANTRKPRSR